MRKIIIKQNKLEKIMKKLGFRIARFPTGKIGENKVSFWYVNDKVPYSTQISEKSLIKIIEGYQDSKELICKCGDHTENVDGICDMCKLSERFDNAILTQTKRILHLQKRQK